MCVPRELKPQPFALLTQCSTTEPQEHRSRNFKLIFFTNSAVVVTSHVRSHVVFKFLNYVTDKIVRVVLRVVLTTLALMLRCVQTICVSVKESPRTGERE